MFSLSYMFVSGSEIQEREREWSNFELRSGPDLTIEIYSYVFIIGMPICTINILLIYSLATSILIELGVQGYRRPPVKLRLVHWFNLI